MAEYNIRKATKTDVDTMVELWIESFHDPEDYIRLFYKRNFEQMEIWLLEVEDKIVAMANLLPATMSDRKAEQKAWMLYAGCVKKSYRKRGIWRSMLNFLKENISKQNSTLFLKPASGLENYYQSNGFEVDARWSIISVDSKNKYENVEFSPITAKKLFELRENAFSNLAFVRWDIPYLEWAIEENRYCGGYADGIKIGGEEYYVLSIVKDSELIIMETTMPLIIVESIAGNLLEQYGAKHITLRMNFQKNNLSSEIASMSIFNKIKLPYVNVILL